MLREELADYNRLCFAFRELHQKHEEQKIRIITLLAQGAELKRRLADGLEKTERLCRRLSQLQRRQLGLLLDPLYYSLPGSAKTRLSQMAVLKPELEPVPIREFPQEYKNKRELREAEIRIITMIDGVKKKLLRLELLEMRLRELLVSVTGAMEVYELQWRKVRRGIYPLGIISVCWKCIKQILGGSYFSAKDLGGIAFLWDLSGNIAGMADSPVFQG
ncbi:MAG: hypothetical protein FWF22_01375 [Treponema sp.]|nr:hypothetical protein [Treponema sp.]